MVDYKQKAREAVQATPDHMLTYDRVMFALATTLEALDKAEAERDALRKAGKALIDRVHDFMAGALTNEQIARHLRKAFPELARHRQQAERAFEERERKLREALKEISELHGEINPSNYDHDDACELNRQFCYALTVADLAIKETPDAQ